MDEFLHRWTSPARSVELRGARVEWYHGAPLLIWHGTGTGRRRVIRIDPTTARWIAELEELEERLGHA